MTRHYTKPGPCAYDVGGRRCECSPEGTPLPAYRGGLCRVHRLRHARVGRLGPPGHRAPNPQWKMAERSAQGLLDLGPSSRGTYTTPRPGWALVTWRDGRTETIALPRIEGWRRRGWAAAGEPQGPERRRELVLLKGCRAAAREILAQRARNRVRYGAASRLDTSEESTT